MGSYRSVVFADLLQYAPNPQQRKTIKKAPNIQKNISSGVSPSLESKYYNDKLLFNSIMLNLLL